MHPLRWALLLTALASLPFWGCGGNVIIDPAGSGGAPPTGTGTGPGPTSTGSDTTGTSPGPTTGTGPNQCDLSGFCGDGGQGCIACALATQCSEILAQCQGSTTCLDYANCIAPCQDEPCVAECAAQSPNAADMYNQVVACVVCDVCVVDCAELAGSTLGFPGCG